MSWLELQARFTPIPFGLRHYWKGHLVREGSRDLAEAVIAAAEGSGDDSFVLVELIHGAAHRIPAESAAFGGRRAIANVTALGIWRDAADDAGGIAWARRGASLFEPYSLSGGELPELSRGGPVGGAGRCGVRSRDVRPAAADQGDLGSSEPLPLQREHPAGVTSWLPRRRAGLSPSDLPKAAIAASMRGRSASGSGSTRGPRRGRKSSGRVRPSPT